MVTIPELKCDSRPCARTDVNKIVEGLKTVLQDVSLYKLLLATRGRDARTLLNAFQTLLDDGDVDAYRGDLVIAMLRLSDLTSYYPRSFIVEGVDLESEEPVATGGFADIYRAKFLHKAVCVKMIRMYDPSQVDYLQKTFSKEAIFWRQLVHPNLLPFIGLCCIRSRLCFVSPWVNNGHVVDYLRRNPTANRRLLCLDVAQGIRYLHENNIIHGDLKGANILVNDSGRACVADFGLSSVTDPKILQWTALSSVASRGGTIRWQAPELHDTQEDKIAHNSAESDMYAWACVCYEIFSGLMPFHECLRDAVVISTVAAGGRPTRPPKSSPAWTEWGLTDDIWRLMQECWYRDPAARLRIGQIVARLMEGVVDQRPAASWVDTAIHSTDISNGYSRAVNIVNGIINAPNHALPTNDDIHKVEVGEIVRETHVRYPPMNNPQPLLQFPSLANSSTTQRIFVGSVLILVFVIIVSVVGATVRGN